MIKKHYSKSRAIFNGLKLKDKSLLQVKDQMRKAFLKLDEEFIQRNIDFFVPITLADGTTLRKVEDELETIEDLMSFLNSDLATSSSLFDFVKISD